MDDKDNIGGISPESSGAAVDGEYTITGKSKHSNLWLRLLSVLLAFILWVYVMGVESPTFTTTLAVPISILPDDAPLSVISGYSSTVDVTLQGKRAEISKISAGDLEAYIDISGFTVSGRYNVPVSISVPGSLKITEQSFSSVAVYLDNTSTKNVPISVKLVSYMLEDGELGVNDIVTNISEVTVTGPSA
ncbi:MAG: CdaR family protein, partial [Eubacteriales bacterium]